MIPVEYRAVARWFMEPPPRSSMGHRTAFIDQAHRTPKPEPLWLAAAVLLAGLAGLWFLVTVVLAAVPA